MEEKLEKEREKALKEGKKIHLFSSATYPEVKKEEKEEEQEIAKIESKVSSVIEKPNYDLTEALSEPEKEKIFKIEKGQEEKPKAKPSKLKYIIMSVLFAIFGIWGIVNIATIDNLSASVSQIESVYEMNLATYLKNLATIDATSADNMNNLLPVIPEQGEGASEIVSHSNWFDRFCNFIGGLFGG